MFANTLTLTVNAVAKVLQRVNQDNYGSEYVLISDVERITMRIRHSVDKLASGDVDRHNVYVEHVIFATPTVSEKYYSVTGTLRARVGSSPTTLLQTWVGFSTLMATLDDGLVLGEN